MYVNMNEWAMEMQKSKELTGKAFSACQDKGSDDWCEHDAKNKRCNHEADKNEDVHIQPFFCCLQAGLKSKD